VIIGIFRWLYYKNYNEITLIGYLQNFTLAWFFYQYFMYSAMLIILLAIDYYQKFKRKETQALETEKLLVETQLSSLKSQLHPHFLFNTLNSISMLVRMKKNEKANKVITQFGDLLRQVLHKKDAQFTSLEKEIEFIDNYLGIENIRFNENFKYKISVSEEALQVKIPDMILQPVVENCIKHGFKSIDHALKIDITARLNGEYLLVHVEDNGSGFNPDDEVFLNRGIGLRNIFDRYEKIYGTSGVEVHSKPGEGTKVSFKFPKKAANE
jgi:sensor histidine kinase YesM